MQNGIIRISFKTFKYFLSHCKVSCDNPCCVKTCGEDNHCIFHIDTHENGISDDEEQIEKQ